MEISPMEARFAAQNKDLPAQIGVLVELANRLNHNIGELDDLSARLSVLAERLFGPVPMPANSSTSPGIGSDMREPPQIDVLEKYQNLLSESIENLRRQIDRFGRL